MQTNVPFRILAGVVGGLFVVLGGMLFLNFFGYQQPDSTPTISTGPMGHYFVAFTGCALVAWGGGLLGVARWPESGRGLTASTGVALVMMAAYRMVAWIVGDYYLMSGLLRFEAGLFLLLALAFVWLRPRVAAPASGGA